MPIIGFFINQTGTYRFSARLPTEFRCQGEVFWGQSPIVLRIGSGWIEIQPGMGLMALKDD